MEVSDDSSYSVDEKNDCSSSDNDSFCFEGYVNEPEYSKAEFDAMKFDNFNDESESESSSENFVVNIFSQVYFRKQPLQGHS